eukprot:15425752-Alexandrium_andersonii.AAC.1
MPPETNKMPPKQPKQPPYPRIFLMWPVALGKRPADAPPENPPPTTKPKLVAARPRAKRMAP